MTDYNKKDEKKDKKYGEKSQYGSDSENSASKSTSTNSSFDASNKKNQNKSQDKDKQSTYQKDKSAYKKVDDEDLDNLESKNDEEERGEEDKPIDQDKPGFKMASKKNNVRTSASTSDRMGEKGGIGSSAYVGSNKKSQYESEDKQKYGTEKPLDSYKKSEDKKQPKKDESPIDEQ